MSVNTILYSWKRSLPGRERASAQHFDEFMDYLAGLRQDGLIDSYDSVLLEPNGAHINGFILIKGEDAQLGQMLDSPAWRERIISSMAHLDEPVLAYGASGAMLREWMNIWLAKLPA